jgi:photosystem II stability/assembly factor-like uncharacterized protein
MSLYQIVTGSFDTISTYISYNTGSTWTDITQTPNPVFTIASSTNGTVLAIGPRGKIYISTNSGTTWTFIDIGEGNIPLSSSMSGDGTKLIVKVLNSIYLYTYNGTTFGTAVNITPIIPAGSICISCTMSKNGGVFYVGTSGSIYKSIDGGNNWTSGATPNGSWYALATNSDGTKVLAADNGGYLYLSNDGGVTFAAQVSVGPGNWKLNSLDMTPDGTGLIACATNGFVWISIDGGAWTAQNQPNQPNMGSKEWQAVSCSSDFKVLGAVANNGYVYVSTDYGTTWTPQTNIGISTWIAIQISELSGVCFRDSTRVVMADGTFKAIKDLQRGDEILTDKKNGETKKVARILQFMSTGKAIQIPMHLIGNSRSIVCSRKHPFWIGDNRRILAADIEGAETIKISEWLYNIQFEDEGSYYVEGVKVDAVSPDNCKHKLPKELYFDETKYEENRVVNSEDDECRKKPKMTKHL